MSQQTQSGPVGEEATSEDSQEETRRWERGLMLLTDWLREHPGEEPGVDAWVGRWLDDQRSRAERGLLSAERRVRLETLGRPIPAVDPQLSLQQRALEEAAAAPEAPPVERTSQVEPSETDPVAAADAQWSLIWARVQTHLANAAPLPPELARWVDVQRHDVRWGRLTPDREAALRQSGLRLRRGIARSRLPFPAREVRSTAAPAAKEKSPPAAAPPAGRKKNARAATRDPAEISRRELQDAAVPSAQIDQWIAKGRLLRTRDPEVFLKTRGLGEEIAAFARGAPGSS